ncbi:hypothetical protein Q31b_47850 [Novipirellula aureliae]|uniref:Uncharacterized protein n=1 Tax=Novipirellula aureliae TaxID=2527966 RepID=A0A5C6DK67_9BACT|nr:hypothetical protein [Novipirellula aureliae]TWU36504.1 hypothetical protein Q31b_47850 [Novipirellula aureliae]
MIRNLIGKKQSDWDDVESVARKLAFWDRWWVLLLIVFAIVIASMVAFFVFLFNFVRDLNPNNALGVNVNEIFLVVAFLLGATLGMHLHAAIGYFANALITGFRSERLFVKYFDERKTMDPKDQTHD